MDSSRARIKASIASGESSNCSWMSFERDAMRCREPSGAGLAARGRVQQSFNGWIVRVDIVARMKGVIRIRRFPHASNIRRLVALPRTVHDSGRGHRYRDVVGVQRKACSTEVSESEARRHNALPEESNIKETSPPSRANSALRAASGTVSCSASASAEAARAARASAPRRSCSADVLLLLVLRFGQSLCQWAPLHQRQGAHLSLHFSFGSRRGLLRSAGFARSSLPRTSNECEALGLDS
eukprot:1330124-Pleurochrysis_carterae.AAC.1